MLLINNEEKKKERGLQVYCLHYYTTLRNRQNRSQGSLNYFPSS